MRMQSSDHSLRMISHLGPRDLSLPQMAAAICCICCVIALSRLLQLNLSGRIAVVATRATLQLLALGLVLKPILSAKEAYLVLPYLLVMMLLAWREAVVKPARHYPGMAAHFLVSLAGSLTLSFVVTAALVLQPSPWYDGQYMIPVCGMMLGNCVTVLSLGVDRYLSSLEQGSAHVLCRLAAGASAWEAALPALRVAMTTGLTPQLNQMSVMGLVSIPGMMTGTVLSGTPPLVAAKYQLMIMFLICFTSSNALAATLILATRRRLFDPTYGLQSDAIGARKSGKSQDALVALAHALGTALRPVLRLLHPSRHRVATRCDEQHAAEAPPAVTTSTEGSAQPCVGTLVRSDGAEPPATEPVLRLRDGAVAIGGAAEGGTATERAPLMERIQLDVYAGEAVALRGPSGCGKSTLLRALARLHPLREGTLELRGVPCGGVGAESWRAQVCYVAQSGCAGLPGSPTSLLAELLRLAAQREAQQLHAADRHAAVELGAQPPDLEGKDGNFVELQVGNVTGGAGGGVGTPAETRLARLAERLALAPALLSQPWCKLSGGEAQRLHLCVLLALRPAVVLLDEPTSACDADAALLIERMLADEASTTSAAVVWVTHDPAQAERVANATLELRRL